jgi:hypothetical protein
MNKTRTTCDVKILVLTLAAGIIVAQSGVSLAATSENSAVRDLAAAKSFAFGGVGVAGLMSEGERNLRAVHSGWPASV